MELHEHIGVQSNGDFSAPTATGAHAGDSYSAYEGLYSEIIRLQPGLREYFSYIGSVVIGTGGQLEWPIAFESMLESAVPTGASAAIQPLKASAPKSNVRTITDDVASIKAAFGLSMSQLAEALKVRRPTIYSWIDSNHAPEALRRANRNRLSELRELAQTWNGMSNVPPGRYLTANVSGDLSLLELLKAAPLDKNTVLRALEAIQAAMPKGERAQTYGERLRGMGFADRPSLTKQRKTPAS